MAHAHKAQHAAGRRHPDRVLQVEEVRATYGKRVRELEARLAETTRKTAAAPSKPQAKQQSPRPHTHEFEHAPSASEAGRSGPLPSAASRAVDAEGSQTRGFVLADESHDVECNGSMQRTEADLSSTLAHRMRGADVFAAFAVAGSSAAALDRIGTIVESLMADAEEAARLASRVTGCAAAPHAQDSGGGGSGQCNGCRCANEAGEIGALQMRLRFLEQSQRDRYLEVISRTPPPPAVLHALVQDVLPWNLSISHQNLTSALRHGTHSHRPL